MRSHLAPAGASSQATPCVAMRTPAAAPFAPTPVASSRPTAPPSLATPQAALAPTRLLTPSASSHFTKPGPITTLTPPLTPSASSHIAQPGGPPVTPAARSHITTSAPVTLTPPVTPTSGRLAVAQPPTPTAAARVIQAPPAPVSRSSAAPTTPRFLTRGALPTQDAPAVVVAQGTVTPRLAPATLAPQGSQPQLRNHAVVQPSPTGAVAAPATPKFGDPIYRVSAAALVEPTVGTPVTTPHAQTSLATQPEIVLFLDIDGVLHPMEGNQIFNETCCRFLQQIIQTTGASVVLSSTWRKIPRQKDLVNKMLAALGLAQLIGQTPDLGGGANSRDAEICDWVDKHPSIKRWIAIDDMDLTGGPTLAAQRLRGHFVRTDKNIGLTPQTKDLAIGMLTGRSF